MKNLVAIKLAAVFFFISKLPVRDKSPEWFPLWHTRDASSKKSAKKKLIYQFSCDDFWRVSVAQIQGGLHARRNVNLLSKASQKLLNISTMREIGWSIFPIFPLPYNRKTINFLPSIHPFIAFILRLVFYPSILERVNSWFGYCERRKDGGDEVKAKFIILKIHFVVKEGSRFDGDVLWWHRVLARIKRLLWSFESWKSFHFCADFETLLS